MAGTDELDAPTSPIESTSPALPDAAPEPAAPEELKDTLKRAFADAQTKADAASSKPAKRGPSTVDDRPRGPDGKFAPINSEAPATATATTESTTKPATEKVEGAITAPASGPPSSWSQDAKSAWETASPAIQAAALKREQEFSDGIKQYADKAKRADAIESVFTPQDRQMFQRAGVQTDAEAIKSLLGWNRLIASNPTAAFPALARAFNFDLNSLSQSPAAQPGATADANPLQPVLGEVSQLRGSVTAIAQQLAQEREARAQAELSGWAKDKPHFEAVRETMGRLMQAGMAADLDAAYQTATRMDPTIFADLQQAEAAKLAKQQADQAAAEVAKATQRATAARQAQVSPKGRGPVVNGAARPAKVASIRDSLKEAMSEVRGN